MTNSLITHIVPITYFGGTGGHLLRSLLIAAKLKNNTLWEFSPNGNAHKAPKEKFNRPLSSIHGVNITIEEILALVKESEVFRELDTMYYHQFHYLNLDKLMEHFAKSIRICYSLEDIEEIGLVFVAKHAIDGGDINQANLTELKKHCMSRFFLATKLQRLFQPVQSPNILCVNWNTLLRGDANQLFDNLHAFTGVENFSGDNLKCWRELTLKGIKDIRQRIK
jgi:hypothetical protein